MLEKKEVDFLERSLEWALATFQKQDLNRLNDLNEFYKRSKNIIEGGELNNLFFEMGFRLDRAFTGYENSFIALVIKRAMKADKKIDKFVRIVVSGLMKSRSTLTEGDNHIAQFLIS